MKRTNKMVANARPKNNNFRPAVRRSRTDLARIVALILAVIALLAGTLGVVLRHARSVTMTVTVQQ